MFTFLLTVQLVTVVVEHANISLCTSINQCVLFRLRFKCSHTTVYDINLCHLCLIHCTLTYVGVRCYTQRLNYFLDMIKKNSAYASEQIVRYAYPHHTLGIR